MYALGQSDPIGFYAVEGLLHMAEQYSGSGESNWHRVQINQDQEPVPLIYTNTLLMERYGGEDVPEAVLLVWGQGQRHVDGVYHPP